MKKILLITSLLLLSVGVIFKSVFAQTQTTPSVLYIPLIGLTSVPEPLALPTGPGKVTYKYAVKNFLQEVALANVIVVDNTCNPVKYISGDDNEDSLLDYSETWRYVCVSRLTKTTKSTATATGRANNIVATHNAYATVIVGSNNPPPLVSIINISKIAYPLSLPIEGGKITFTYKVNNPGVVPLSNVKVVDDKCIAMSGKLGDINANNQLDINEVWIYTCTMNLKQTTTNTVRVEAYANGLKATADASVTVKVESTNIQTTAEFPKAGTNPSLKTTIWKNLFVILVILIMFYFLIRQCKLKKSHVKKQ